MDEIGEIQSDYYYYYCYYYYCYYYYCYYYYCYYYYCYVAASCTLDLNNTNSNCLTAVERTDIGSVIYQHFVASTTKHCTLWAVLNTRTGCSWRTAKHCSWGCKEDGQRFYVSRSTLGLLCHPVAKIIYNLAISYSKSKQCKNHKITISSVIYAHNLYLSSNDRHSSDSDRSSFNIEPKILLVTSIWTIVSKWIYIAIRSKSIWIIWNRLKKHFHQHF